MIILFLGKYEIDPRDVEILEQLGAGCFGVSLWSFSISVSLS